LHELVERRLPSDDLALLLRRERAAAALLARHGGLPGPDPAHRHLVCGPLRITELGLQRRLSDFLRGLPTTDDDTMALLRQFSGIGLAVAQLDADRPEVAALAALDLRCPSCARTGRPTDPAVIPEPLLCEPGCPEFDDLNPAFSGYPDKHEELTRASAALAAQTLLGIARADITTATMDLADAKRCWRAAVTLAMRFNRREAALHEIADDALGRAMVLSERGDHTGAVDVLDAALAAIPAKDETEHERVTTELALRLNSRAVSLFNEDDTMGQQALADLRRAVRYQPELPLPRRNLGRLLREMSDQALRTFRTSDGIRLLSEAVHQFEIGVTKHGTTKFRDELERARQELERLLDEYADQPADTES
jgi:tetratricopeptide (TPR) repeat protein